jgi:tight adherence protein B
MLVFAIVHLLTSLVWVAAVAGIAAGTTPCLLVRYAAIRRVRLFEDQFPQAIDLIASSLRAGHAFTTGVSMVSDEVADPTGAEFRLLYDHQNYGMPLPDALKAFTRRVPLLDARFFVTAVMTQREAGGNLAEVLDNLSGLIRERSRVKRQVRVASAHGRITGWILSLMPPALALLMTIIAPAHMKNFIDDPLGVRMILAALVLQVAGTLAIRRIVNVEF